MRSIVHGFVLFLTLFLPLSASAAEGLFIERFTSDVTVQESGVVRVVESIDVMFAEELHGIYRDIPLTYERADGTKNYTEIDVESVTDGSREVPYEETRNRSSLRLKIGDPDVTVQGATRYVITYEVAGVLLPYETYDELYWNATGNDWEMRIEASAVTVRVERGTVEQSSCYEGPVGSRDRCAPIAADGTAIAFASTRALAPGEGMTVAVAYTKGAVPILAVEPPPPFDWRSALVAFAAVFALSLGALAWLWRTKGRDRYLMRKSLHDPDAKEMDMPLGADETIVVEYDSPGKLRPAEIGVLMDERAHTLDVSATIVDLAVRGYIKFEEVPKTWMFGSTDYKLVSLMKSPAALRSYEQLLLAKLFEGKTEVLLSELKNEFYEDLAAVKKELYAEVVRQGLFIGDPEKVRNTYRVLAVLILLIGGGALFVGIAAGAALLSGAGAGVVAGAILAFVFAELMPRRTAKGREFFRQSRGYKLFVSGTEKYRQPFFEKQHIFMEVLPYAMVFGVTSQLAKAMDEMGVKPPQPSWYVGAHPFNVAAFTTSMNTFEHSLSSAIASAPSGSGSGGGGFSGGGFGGGGGGGW